MSGGNSSRERGMLNFRPSTGSKVSDCDRYQARQDLCSMCYKTKSYMSETEHIPVSCRRPCRCNALPDPPCYILHDSLHFPDAQPYSHCTACR